MISGKDVFKMPKPVNITGRTSSITNAFVNGIIPSIQPTETEILKVLQILGMTTETIRCSYCGDKFTEWDHFRPIVKDKRPTGFISDIKNLVPACGKCNQSKGNQNWKEWMLGNARLSPKTRKVLGIDDNIKRLEEFEKWGNVEPTDFCKLIDEEIWDIHWSNYENIIETMKKCQNHAKLVKEEIQNSVNSISLR